MKGNEEPLSYTDTEIRSYLPTGWSLIDDGGRWDGGEGLWRTTLQDGADVEWELKVRSRDAASAGRLEALRRAIDRLFRNRLG